MRRGAEGALDIEEVLESLRGGATVREARRLLSLHAIEEVGGMARLDVGRQARRGIPEVILAEPKGKADLRRIVRAALGRTDPVVVSRIREGDRAWIAALARRHGARVRAGRGSSTLLLYRRAPPRRGTVGILAAGTSDVGVAEEARLMCEAMGCRCVTAYDVGVAGLHRVFPAVGGAVSAGAGSFVVAAGMEGALPAVVSALVDVPVIGLPVSVGYGYGRGGVAALASMLQSCALGLAVVNIDAGIAAGGLAASIARGAARPRGSSK